MRPFPPFTTTSRPSAPSLSLGIRRLRSSSKRSFLPMLGPQNALKPATEHIGRITSGNNHPPQTTQPHNTTSNPPHPRLPTRGSPRGGWDLWLGLGPTVVAPGFIGAPPLPHSGGLWDTWFGTGISDIETWGRPIPSRRGTAAPLVGSFRRMMPSGSRS
jgi:hypothetical protein